MSIENEKSKEIYAYLAGLIDGEGTVTILPIQPERGHYTPLVIISNTDKDLINWLKKEFGGVIKKNTSTTNLKMRKELFHWILRTRKAYELLKKCYTFLKVKKRQAEVILEFYDTIRPNSTKPLSINEINLRVQLFNKIRKLNGRKRSRELKEFEVRVIISKCPNCNSINEIPRGKKKLELYPFKCKECGLWYYTNSLGKVISSGTC